MPVICNRLGLPHQNISFYRELIGGPAWDAIIADQWYSPDDQREQPTVVYTGATVSGIKDGNGCTHSMSAIEGNFYCDRKAQETLLAYGILPSRGESAPLLVLAMSALGDPDRYLRQAPVSY
jgi:hypothetical protein